MQGFGVRGRRRVLRRGERHRSDRDAALRRIRSLAHDRMSGKASKQFVLRYGGETVGLFDTARECANAYQKHRALTRSNGYSRREPRYRVTLVGERVTVGRLLVLARGKAVD